MFFHPLIFARSLGSCLNWSQLGLEFKHLRRDPVNVNAMKQTCMIPTCKSIFEITVFVC